MIRLRSKLLQLGLLVPRFGFSILKQSSTPTQQQKSNPLARKSFQQIYRIVSSTNPQTQLTICGMALSAVNNHLINDKNRLGDYSAKQNKVKQDIINICMKKILSDLNRVTPAEISILVELFILMYEVRAIRIKQENLSIYRKQFPQLLKVSLSRDKQGKYVDHFKRIFYATIRGGKRYIVLKQALQYLIVHDFKTNEDCLKFFDSIASIHNYGFYDKHVEVVVDNYISAQHNTLDNCQEWVRPVLIDVIKKYCCKTKVQNSYYGRKLMKAFSKLTKENNLQINYEIQILNKLIQWLIQFNPQPIRMKEHAEFVKSLQHLIIKVKKDVEKADIIQFSTFRKTQKASIFFNQVGKKSARILGKPQTYLSKQLQYIYQGIVKKGLILNMPNLSSGQIVSVVKFRLNINQNLQNQLIQALFDHLNKYSNDSFLISRIRIPQYIARNILQTKSLKFQPQMIQFAEKVQKQIGVLREFQILRLTNILKFLKINSSTFDNYIKQKTDQKQQNEELIIQNISRTNLRNFGTDIILPQLNKLTKRFRSNTDKRTVSLKKKKIVKQSETGKIDFQIIKSVWYSFKRFEFESIMDNKNPIFEFWFYKNYDILQNVLVNQTIFESFMSITNRQMTVYNADTPGSINYEIIIEALKIWKDSDLKTEGPQYHRVIMDNVKNFCQSSHIFQLCFLKYRHSYLVKMLWAQGLLGQFFIQQRQNHKCKRQIQYINLLLRLDKLKLYRVRPTFANALFLKTMQVYSFYQEIRMKHLQNFVEYWLWLIKNDLQSAIKSNNDHNWTIQPITQTLKQYYGIAYSFQYLLSINKIQPQITSQQLRKYMRGSIIPVQIYTGTLTTDTHIEDQRLLDLLTLSRTLVYFCRLFSDKKIGDILAEKIMNIKNFQQDYKLIEATNLMEKLAGIVSPGIQLKYEKWIQNKILTIGNLTENPSLLDLYLQFNIIPEEHRERIMDYVKTEMSYNNFFMTEIIYVNGFVGISKEASELMKMCLITRVPAFLVDTYHRAFLILLQNFLGICLNQDDVALLQEYVALYASPYKKMFNRETRPNLFALLEVARSRLKKQTADHGLLTSIIEGIIKENPQIRNKVLNQNMKRNKNLLAKFGIKQQIDATSTLYKFESKLAYIQYNEPGKQKLMSQYFRECLNYKDLKMVKISELVQK